MLFFMLFLAIVPMLLVLAISMNISVGVIESNAEKSNISSLQMVAQNIDSLLVECIKQGNMISSDTIVRSYLKADPNSETEKNEGSSLNDRLMFLKGFTLNEIPFTYVMGENGLMIKSTYSFFKDIDFRNTDWYKEVIASDYPVWFDAHVDQFMVVSRTTFEYATMGMPVIDKATGEKLGVVLIDFREDTIYDSISYVNADTKSEIFFYDDDDYPILRRDDNSLVWAVRDEIIRFKQSDQTVGEIGDEYYFEPSGEIEVDNFRATIAGQEYFICTAELVSGWKVVNVTSISELTRDISQIVPVSILIAIIVCVIGILLSIQFSSSIAKPVRRLTRLMKKVETGDFSGKFKVRYQDEIGQLGTSYNMMLDEIQRLMDTVMEEQAELRKAQFKILQEQINPHFLYNTLDSINWLSRMGRNDEVVVMVNAFTKLLRIALSRGKDVITVGEETEYINNYLTIQKIRYKKKLFYEVDIPRSMHSCFTLKLILQPIVENAIYHGVKSKKGGGYVYVEGREEEGSLVFTVRDTGAGLPEDAVRELNANMKRPLGEEWTGEKSFGMKNVSDRIRVFFGYPYGLVFESKEGEGTTVTITIPKLRKWELE